MLANEMAPRVHNSGHWTIEGAFTSQFENHIRAVCGFPLGRTETIGYSTMYNFIGAVPPAAEVLADPDARLHIYGKESSAGPQGRPCDFAGRKCARIDPETPGMGWRF